ncbi:MAG TPA: hypothetical protein VGY57_03585, partial [Vicinamibacterales bacterium]|nr:hypothetical protein [Vicinamibacterales bacterium]
EVWASAVGAAKAIASVIHVLSDFTGASCRYADMERPLCLANTASGRISFEIGGVAGDSTRDAAPCPDDRCDSIGVRRQYSDGRESWTNACVCAAKTRRHDAMLTT